MPDTISNDPIDPSLAALLTLFEGPLQAVTFPDIDRGTLSELADSVRCSADDVEQALAILDAARRLLLDRQETLLARSHRALAYARVYADDKPELRAELDRIQLPRAIVGADLRATDPAGSGEPPQRKRGRPRKIREGDPLFRPADPVSLPSEATAAE